MEDRKLVYPNGQRRETRTTGFRLELDALGLLPRWFTHRGGLSAAQVSQTAAPARNQPGRW
jgi:hypothetical protein